MTLHLSARSTFLYLCFNILNYTILIWNKKYKKTFEKVLDKRENICYNQYNERGKEKITGNNNVNIKNTL